MEYETVTEQKKIRGDITFLSKDLFYLSGTIFIIAIIIQQSFPNASYSDMLQPWIVYLLRLSNLGIILYLFCKLQYFSDIVISKYLLLPIFCQTVFRSPISIRDYLLCMSRIDLDFYSSPRFLVFQKYQQPSYLHFILRKWSAFWKLHPQYSCANSI